MNAWHRTTTALLGLTTALLGACGDDDADKDPIEIAGSWEYEIGGDPVTEVIDDQSWDLVFTVADVVEYDNEDNWAVLYMPSDLDEALGPETYQRVVWTEPDDGVFYYCTVEFGLETLDEALASDAEADDSDLDGEGCNGFPWTMMNAVED